MVENLYERYAKIRDLRGFSDYKVSQLAGIKGTAPISNWKNGKYVPKDDKMERIANSLGVSLEYLKGKETFIECEDCGYKYDLLDKESYLKHEKIHNLMKEAEKKYGFYYNSEYCMYNENQDILTLNDTVSGFDINVKLSAYEDFLKCDFSYLLRKSLFSIKYNSFEDYAREKILADRHETFMSVDLFEELCKKYKIDSSYIDDNAKLLANISNNPQLMRILEYAKKLTPEILNILEIQAKALAQQNDNDKKDGNSDI